MALCMCEWPDGCGGVGMLYCEGCGGDQCVCTCGGECECFGCDECDYGDGDYGEQNAVAEAD
jgi:hypothetical protein